MRLKPPRASLWAFVCILLSGRGPLLDGDTAAGECGQGSRLWRLWFHLLRARQSGQREPPGCPCLAGAAEVFPPPHTSSICPTRSLLGPAEPSRRIQRPPHAEADLVSKAGLFRTHCTQTGMPLKDRLRRAQQDLPGAQPSPLAQDPRKEQAQVSLFFLPAAQLQREHTAY